MYSPTLGRFISRDPLGYVDGMSLYRGYFSPSGVDPSGLLLPPRGNTLTGLENDLVSIIYRHFTRRRGAGGSGSSPTKGKVCAITLFPHSHENPPWVSEAEKSGADKVLIDPIGSIEDLVTWLSTDDTKDKKGGSDCCKLIIIGHQGAPAGNIGGVTSYPTVDGQEEANFILWALDQKAADYQKYLDLHQQIGKKLKSNCNKTEKCSITALACGDIDSGVDANRQMIANQTGCVIVGSDRKLAPGQIHFNSDNPKAQPCTLGEPIGEQIKFPDKCSKNYYPE